MQILHNTKKTDLTTETSQDEIHLSIQKLEVEGKEEKKELRCT